MKNRNKIIDDLLIKRPVGPRGTVRYTVEESYCYDKGKYVKKYTPDHQSYGYDDLVLFQLGISDRSQAEHYVRSRFYDGASDYNLTRGQRGGVTRKTNRLWSRLGGSISRVQAKGATGIYKVTCGRGYYSNEDLGHIHADSVDDGLTKAELLFSYLMKDDYKIKVVFMRVGTADEMTSLNDKVLRMFKNKIESFTNDIEAAKKEIVRYHAKIDAVALVQLHEIASTDISGVQCEVA